MAKLSPMMIAPPAIFAGLAALFFIGMNRENPNELPSTRINKPAPAVTLEPLGDKVLLTTDVVKDGEIKLINFWGTWCVACRQEHPMLLKLEDKLGIKIHGVNFDDTQARALAYLEEEGDPFATVGEDTHGKTKIDWGVYGAPETFLLDQNGVVVLRIAGPITERVVAERLRPALEKLSQ